MFRSNSAFAVVALLAVTQAVAQTRYPGVGRIATPAEIAAWDIDVRADFKGLPPGSGSVAKGEAIWEAKCTSCHGSFGESNAFFPPVVGGTTAKDVETGRVDPFAAKAWEKYDISRFLRDNWKTLAPKLKGKIHIIVGTADTFHLDEAVHLLDAELKKLGSDAKFEYIEGRDHFNLYQGGLRDRIANEMYQVARPKTKTAKK